MVIGNFISRLDRVRKTRRGWVARCPAHEDRNPSLSTAVGGSRIPRKCFAGCGVEAILRALGLKLADSFVDAGEPHSQKKYAHPITVGDLARDKKLPSDFLRSFGLEDCPQGVRIRYSLMDASPAPRQRIRTALVAREGLSSHAAKAAGDEEKLCVSAERRKANSVSPSPSPTARARDTRVMAKPPSAESE